MDGMTPCFLITITDVNREKKLNDVFDRAGIVFRFHAHGASGHLEGPRRLRFWTFSAFPAGRVC